MRGVCPGARSCRQRETWRSSLEFRGQWSCWPMTSLLAEGFAVGRKGSGTYVSAGVAHLAPIGEDAGFAFWVVGARGVVGRAISSASRAKVAL